MKIFQNLSLKILLIAFFVLGISTTLNAQLAPTLVYPQNGDSCLTKEFVVQWDTVSGATQYRVQVSTSSTWTTPDVTETVISHPTNTYSLVVSQDNQMYYWRVSASYTQTEHFSETWQFKTKGAAPELLLPEDNDICVDITPGFQWSSMEGATSYAIQIAYSTTFTGQQVAYENYSVSSNSFTVSLPNYFTNYYWRVATNYGDCRSDWSEPFLFSSKQAPPAAVFPTDDSTGLPREIVLEWTEVDQNALYDVELATDVNFENEIFSSYELSETSTTIPMLDYNTDYFWRIRSDMLDCTSEWSETYRFKTEFSAPTLDLPYDGRICLELTYQFRWLQVSGAQSYRLQISFDSTFTDLAIDEDGIFDLIHTVDLPRGLTQYWWRVRGEDANNVGQWSEIRTFTTTVESVEPMIPLNNAKGVPREFYLNWSDKTMGEGSYHVQVATDMSFSDLLYDIEDLDTNAYYIELPQNNTEYYWRVAAFYNECQSEFTTYWSFRTVIGPPTLLTPADSASNQPFDIFFEWTEVLSAESYEFEWSKNPNFIPKNGDNNIYNNHYFKSGFEPDTRYYWRVRAINEDGESKYSESFTFVTTSVGATVPNIVYPIIGSEQVEVNPILEWTQADRAENYHLQFAEDGNFDNILIDVDTLTGTTFQMDTLDKGVMYYWRVSAINDSGETQFSQLAFFTTLIPLPASAPVLNKPADNAEDINANNVIFDWDDVQYAASYEFQIASDENFSNIVDSKDPIYTTEFVIKNLDYESTYYWRVRAKNASGIGSWSNVSSFTTGVEVSVKDIMVEKFNLLTYPNPFDDVTKLIFDLASPADVEINVHDITGRKVESLTNKFYGAGEHIISWEPKNLPNSTYFYHIKIGNFETSMEVVLAK